MCVRGVKLRIQCEIVWEFKSYVQIENEKNIRDNAKTSSHPQPQLTHSYLLKVPPKIVSVPRSIVADEFPPDDEEERRKSHSVLMMIMIVVNF